MQSQLLISIDCSSFLPFSLIVSPSWAPPFLLSRSLFYVDFVPSFVAFSVANFATLFFFCRLDSFITSTAITYSQSPHTKEDILCCDSRQTFKSLLSLLPLSPSPWFYQFEIMTRRRLLRKWPHQHETPFPDTADESESIAAQETRKRKNNSKLRWWGGFKLFLGRVSRGRRAADCRQMTRCRCRLLSTFWHFRCCCCRRRPPSSSSTLSLFFFFFFCSLLFSVLVAIRFKKY